MRRSIPLFAACVTFACASADPKDEPAFQIADAQAAVEGESDGAADESAPTKTAVLFPADAAEIVIWPEEYRGELLVLDAAAHGKMVEAGEVIARLESRGIEEQWIDAETSLSSAQVAHQALLERNAIQAEAAAGRLARAEASVDRAQRALTGFESRERDFQLRSDALSRARAAAWEADQVDELAQLEAMYEADELVDATEEIVLKRSRRDLASTKAQNALSEDQRKYRTEVSDELTAEARREDVARQVQDLAHLRRTTAIDARGRDDAARRSEVELAKKEERLARLRNDRKLFELRAPAAGMLLHGSLRQYEEGGAPGEVHRGSQLGSRKGAFVVAQPGRLAATFQIAEGERDAWPDGAGVLVQSGEASFRGELHVDALPTVTSGDASQFRARVTIDEAMPGLLPGMHVTVSVTDARP